MTTATRRTPDELTKLRDGLAARIADTEAQHEQAKAAAATLAFEVESGHKAKVRDLAVCEKRRDGLAEELVRLRGAHDEVQRRIVDELAGFEHERQQELGRKYIALKDSVRARNLKMASVILSLTDDGAACATEAKEAHRIALQLGLRDGGPTHGVPEGYMRMLLGAVLAGIWGAGRAKSAEREAMKALERPWRRGLVDETLKQLGL